MPTIYLITNTQISCEASTKFEALQIFKARGLHVTYNDISKRYDSRGINLINPPITPVKGQHKPKG